MQIINWQTDFVNYRDLCGIKHNLKYLVKIYNLKFKETDYFGI